MRVENKPKTHNCEIPRKKRNSVCVSTIRGWFSPSPSSNFLSPARTQTEIEDSAEEDQLCDSKVDRTGDNEAENAVLASPTIRNPDHTIPPSRIRAEGEFDDVDRAVLAYCNGLPLPGETSAPLVRQSRLPLDTCPGCMGGIGEGCDIGEGYRVCQGCIDKIAKYPGFWHTLRRACDWNYGQERMPKPAWMAIGGKELGRAFNWNRYLNDQWEQNEEKAKSYQE